MLNILSTTETRITYPTYFAAAKGQTLHLSVGLGRGYVSSPERVKITPLANGDYSIRALGKGGRPALHVRPTCYIIIVDSAGNLAYGEVQNLI